jgi:hypothetical protein
MNTTSEQPEIQNITQHFPNSKKNRPLCAKCRSFLSAVTAVDRSSTALLLVNIVHPSPKSDSLAHHMKIKLECGVSLFYEKTNLLHQIFVSCSRKLARRLQ